MRSASAKNIATLALLAGLMVASAGAAPVIRNWTGVPGTTEEAIQLGWTETATAEVSTFPEASQVIVVFPGASIQEASGIAVLPLTDLRNVSRARLQAVTLASGEKGTQLTLSLREWVNPRTESDANGFRLVVDVPESLRKVDTPAEENVPGLELTDDAIRQMEEAGWGSAAAPATGAGQAPATEAGLANFYVPPSGNNATAASAAIDLGELAVNTKLDERVVRVDFQGTNLENVLRLIAERSELNILIKPTDVAGKKVTLRLRNVTLRQLMDSILKMNNLGYTIESGGIIMVVPRSMVQTSNREMVLETIPINWVSAKDVAAAVKMFADEDEGMIEASDSSNLLLVKGVPETVRQIRSLVSQIDRPEKQVLIELRLVNMSETARRSIGTRTDFYDQSADPRFQVDPATGTVGSGSLSNSVSNTGSSTNSSSASNSLTSLTRTNTSTSTSGGTSSSSSTSSADTGLYPNSSGGLGLLAPGAEAGVFRTIGSVGVFGADYDVNFQLNMQEERGEAVTLSNPTVLSLNNMEASVEILRQIPYQTAINSDQGSVATVEFKQVGTKVTLLPRITNNGYVMMSINPEQVIDTGARPGGVPQTDERKVSAAVIVKDEQTIALGGLRQFDSAASENGVPYLLRVPVISWLFKNQTNSQNKTELYLFVTPHIIKDPTPTSYQQALYDKIDYNWDLPDYYFDEVFARKAPGETPEQAK